MCPALTSIRSDRLAVAQRAVANRALGWRLRVELGGAQSLRSNCSKRNTIDVVRQSPLPGVVPNLTAYVDADARPREGTLHGKSLRHCLLFFFAISVLFCGYSMSALFFASDLLFYQNGNRRKLPRRLCAQLCCRIVPPHLPILPPLRFLDRDVSCLH
jgi:hypothetical protein